MSKKDLFDKLRAVEKYTYKSKFLKREDAYKYLVEYAKGDDWAGFDTLLTEFLFELTALSLIPELHTRAYSTSEEWEPIVLDFIHSEITQIDQ